MATTRNKTVYPQCVCVLFKKAPTARALADAVDGLGEVELLAGAMGCRVTGAGVDEHLGEGCALVVDVVDGPWPDDMGTADPASALARAWALGEFGFCTFPRALTHAVEQGFHYRRAAASVKAHRAVVRLRVAFESRALPAHPPAEATAADLGAYRQKVDRVLAKAFSPADRLVQLFSLGSIADQSLFDLPGALAWFAPAGEKLGDRAFLSDRLEVNAINLFVQTRQVKLDRRTIVVDTCGGHQLGLRDVQAIVPAKFELLADLENFFLSVLNYNCEQGEVVIKDGDTVPHGPGGRWRASWEPSRLDPPRPVLRFELVGEP